MGELDAKRKELVMVLTRVGQVKVMDEITEAVIAANAALQALAASIVVTVVPAFRQLGELFALALGDGIRSSAEVLSEQEFNRRYALQRQRKAQRVRRG